MLMTNDTVQLYAHDRVLEKMGIRFIPAWIHPNHITILRFLMVPFVLWAIWIQSWMLAFILFLLAALTDALDGSLARVRLQITMWGTVADPIADKLLISSVLLVFVTRVLSWWLTFFVIFLELLIIGAAYIRHRKGRMSSANEYGKLKMLFQVIGVGLLLASEVFGWPLATTIASGIFIVAIVFAMISLLTYGL